MLTIKIIIQSQKKILNLLKKLVIHSNKSIIPETLQLFEVCFNKDELYPKEKLLDLFLAFAKNYKSFPKTAFNKINNLAEKLQESSPEKWNSLLTDEEFNKKFGGVSNDSYEASDCIAKQFFFDINLLSAKNGGFKINDFKNNFSDLFSFLTEYSNKSDNKTSVLYKNERSFFKFYIVIENDPKAKQKMESFENLIQIVYENSCKNKKIMKDDIKKLFENISLMHKLDKDLNEQSKDIKTKPKKI